MTAVDRLDGIRDGMGMKAPVKAATTANITLSGEQTIDGVSCVAGDRVLAKNQTSSINNGIYVVSTGVWARAKDFDGARDVVKGTSVVAANGTANALVLFTLTTADPITIGTSSLTFSAASNLLESSADGRALLISDRDWTTPEEHDAVGDGTTDDLAAIQAAIDTGKRVWLGKNTYKISAKLTVAASGTSNGLKITGDGATIRCEGSNQTGWITVGTSGSDIPAQLIWKGFKLIRWESGALRPRPTAATTPAEDITDYGINYVTTDYSGGRGTVTRKWMNDPIMEDITVQGFRGGGFLFDGVRRARFTNLQALDCCLYGAHFKTLEDSYVHGRTMDLGPIGGEQSALNLHYGIAISRGFINNSEGNPGASSSDAPARGFNVVTWHVENNPAYAAFDAHGIPNIVWLNCSCENVAFAFNIEHSNQNEEVTGFLPHNNSIIGGVFRGLTPSASGAFVQNGYTYRPAPFVWIDAFQSTSETPPGPSDAALLRNIRISNCTVQDFGFKGSNVDGPHGGWGGVIAAQGIDGLYIENLSCFQCLGHVVTLSRGDAFTRPIYNVKIDGINIQAHIDPANYGSPGGSWYTPCAVDFNNPNIRNCNVANITGNVDSFMTLWTCPAALDSTAWITVDRSYIFGGATNTIPANLRTYLRAGGQKRAGGVFYVAAAAITTASTRMLNCEVAYNATGIFDLTFPTDVFTDATSIRLLAGGTALVDRLALTVADATSAQLTAINSAGAAFDPTKVDFEIVGE